MTNFSSFGMVAILESKYSLGICHPSGHSQIKTVTADLCSWLFPFQLGRIFFPRRMDAYYPLIKDRQIVVKPSQLTGLGISIFQKNQLVWAYRKGFLEMLFWRTLLCSGKIAGTEYRFFVLGGQWGHHKVAWPMSSGDIQHTLKEWLPSKTTIRYGSGSSITTWNHWTWGTLNCSYWIAEGYEDQMTSCCWSQGLTLRRNFSIFLPAETRLTSQAACHLIRNLLANMARLWELGPVMGWPDWPWQILFCKES